MDEATREVVRQRANFRCEYCLLRQDCSDFTHHIEHIVAKQHHGDDSIENLALACHRCNLNKGPNLSGFDPETGIVERLFHPRSDAWKEHFEFQNARIEGLTPSGRATVQLLVMNDLRRLELRLELLARRKLI